MFNYAHILILHEYISLYLYLYIYTLGGLNHCLFLPLLREMIQFDEYFFKGFETII